MRLISLRLQNFMGIRDFKLDTQGRNVSVFGDNGVGKTTLFSAFTWLLFGKDSLGRADFEVKTLRPDGEAIHNLDHAVEAVLDIGDGRTMTLGKTYREKWTKKRGSALSEFSGHTVDHYVDGVPVPKGEYDKAIAELVDEKVFRLLTSPTYFNEQLHWQERRRLLLEVCGDLSDADVIASDKALAGLPGILRGRKLDDHKKVIIARRAEINKELERIPVRIDEAQRALPDISSLDRADLDTDIAQLQKRLRDLDQQSARIESGGEVAELRRQISEIESELLDIRNSSRKAADAATGEKRKQLASLLGGRQMLETERIRIDGRIANRENEIKALEDANAKLRAQFIATRDQTLVLELADVCPCCGQAIPVWQLEEAREKAEADFKGRQAEKMEEINTLGKANNEKIQELRLDVVGMKRKGDELGTDISEMQQQIDALQQEINALTAGATDVTADPAYAAKAQAKAELVTKLQQLTTDQKEAVDGIRRLITTTNNAIATLQRDRQKFEQCEQGEERIAELGAQQRELAAEFERLEQELHLVDLFTKTKVSLLTDRINSKFRVARFKLFDQQINGGLAECCETTVNGVPFSGGLNHASRIKAGLDIVSTLSDHYGFSAPLFIDNAEAITRLPECASQVIALYASGADKALRVEEGADWMLVFDHEKRQPTYRRANTN